jgi:hypothetical protein
MALRSAGVPCSSPSVSRAFTYMASLQRPSHGYALYPGDAADSMSTSWVVQARMTCGLPNPRALAYLADRQLPSGAYNYQKGVTRTPVWVTAQVMPARNGRHYPILPR